MRYPLTFYTTQFLERWQAGREVGPIVLINPDYREDEGLYQHELTHVKQWALPVVLGLIAGLVAGAVFPALSLLFHGGGALLGLLLGAGIHPLAYLAVRRYRLWAEVQAYGAQMCYRNRKGEYLAIDDAAERLALPQYDLGITVEQAKAAFS